MNGSGWLASIKFLVLGYGSTVLNINSTRTYLINNPLETIESTKTNGYFSNKIPGDLDGDGDVDPDDFYIFSGAYGTSVGEPAYNPEADLDGDGDVDSDDFYIFAGNYGKSI